MSEWAVPGYTELKELGSGGFGSVRLARHDATGTPVAIKYLRADVAGDPQVAEMFRAEAITLGSLDDAHVTRLYEYVESPAGAAIVMELVDGVTLREILSRYGKTSPEAALLVLYGSLLGLAAAHARGVVHRDYKPTNVLVNAYGASKLTDFGIAVLAGTDVPTGATAAYAPPEQWDAAPASPASDVYAATVTFYECLTGARPFTGQSDQTLAEQHRHGTVPMAPVPEPLRPLVARGMAKDPQYRPADAAALATELRAVAAVAYGADWEDRGRSQLGEAALVLAALWPTAGVPALQGATIEQVRLSQGAHSATGSRAAQGSQGQPAAHAPHAPHAAHAVQGSQSQPASRAELHRWHLWHLRHEEHLAHLSHREQHDGSRASAARPARQASRAGRAVRVTGVIVAAAAVAAAAGTVAATSRPSSAGGAGHPAAVAYAESVATLPVTATSGFKSVDGDVYVQYHDRADSNAEIKGSVPDATAGEVARLYSQPFPFTGAPVLVATYAIGGGSSYAFGVSPVVATHYQVRLFKTATAATALANSAVTTIYVVETVNQNVTHCSARPFCRGKYVLTVYVPPAALPAELSKHWYVYIGVNLQPSGTNPPPPADLLIANGSPPLASGTASVTASQRTGADSYTATINDSFNWGDHAYTTLYWMACDKNTEAVDGVGLPGSHGCGDARVANGNEYLG